MVDYYEAFLDIMGNYQRYYSYLAFKNVTVNYLIKKYGSLMNNIRNEITFVRILVKILGLFEDSHVIVRNSKGRSFETYRKPAISNYNYSLTYRKYFSKGLKAKNKAGAIGVYEDLLYIHINSWSNDIFRHLSAIFSYFEFMILNHNMKKLIIDVRSNRGGNDKYANRFLSYLIPKGHKMPVARYLFRLDPDNPKKLGREYVRFCPAHPSLHFAGQIVCLISNQCMSSNEYFVMGLEALKHYTLFGFSRRVILIGDTTFGSSGNPKEFSHPSGIKYTIPSWICYTSKGKLLEGHGIKPDIHIKSSKTISWSKDRAFEAALKVLRLR